jgi:hypothetical protein
MPKRLNQTNQSLSRFITIHNSRIVRVNCDWFLDAVSTKASLSAKWWLSKKLIDLLYNFSSAQSIISVKLGIFNHFHYHFFIHFHCLLNYLHFGDCCGISKMGSVSNNKNIWLHFFVFKSSRRKNDEKRKITNGTRLCQLFSCTKEDSLSETCVQRL